MIDEPAASADRNDPHGRGSPACAVAAALADAHVVVRTKHGHAAMDTGTEWFTTEVLRFLTAA